MKKGIVALIIFAAVPFFFVHAYSSPGKPTGFVNDFAQILSAEEKTNLETTLTTLKKETDAEISVVTVPTIGEDEVIETYAVELFEEWQIGEKGKDNGLLLLVAVQEKKMRIEVGYGLEGDVVDSQASQIIRNILTPAFREGKYGEGIQEAVRVLSELIRKNPNALPAEENNPGVNFSGNWIYFIIFIPMWLASILGRSKSWWAGGVLGVIAGFILGNIFSTLVVGGVAAVILGIVGLIFDFVVSKTYSSRVSHGMNPPWWIGGPGSRGGGGGFGGFGGGRSGGGGASGGW